MTIANLSSATLRSNRPRISSPSVSGHSKPAATDFASHEIDGIRIRRQDPLLGNSPSPNLSSGPLRHRRSRTDGPHVDRSTPPRPAKVVADPAARSHGLRRFALSMFFGFRRQSAAHQPGVPRARRSVDARGSRHRTISRTTVSFSDGSSSGRPTCWRAPGRISKRGATTLSATSWRSFRCSAPIGWTTFACSWP